MPGRANPEFLRRAIRLATENVVTGRGGPFAAVIVREGKIVGEGVNTVTASHDPTAHGEVNAIRAAARALGTFTLAGCELYTSCEPCPMCLAASYWARLDTSTTGPVRQMRLAPDSTMRFSTKSCARITARVRFPQHNCWAAKRGRAFKRGSTRHERLNIEQQLLASC